MANLTPEAGWDDVLQLETTTRAVGGAGGVMNAQAQALLNRIEQLRQDVSALGGGGRNHITEIVVPSGEGDGYNELEIDYLDGDYFTVEYSGDITAFTFINLPDSDTPITLMINLNMLGSGHTIDWPGSFMWQNGTIPTPDNNDLLALTSFNGGSTWFASLGLDFRAPA